MFSQLYFIFFDNRNLYGSLRDDRSIRIGIAFPYIAFFFMGSFFTDHTVEAASTENRLTEEVLNVLTYEDFALAKEEFDKQYIPKDHSIEEKNKLAVEILISIANDKPSSPQKSGLPESYNVLNREEKILAVSSPAQALVVYQAVSVATTVAITYFVNGNAFKHAYWNALMTVEIGYDSTKKWANAHESESAGLGTTMDFHNNEEGRQAALMIIPVYQNLYGRKPTYLEARNTIFNRIDRGVLRRIVNEQLAPTDKSEYQNL